MESQPASLKRPTSGIAVDAAHSLKDGRTEYQGIDIETGEQVLYKNLGNQTVNIGEFLAIVNAVQYIIENDFKPRVIYSDSLVAIKWFKDKATSSSKPLSALKKAEVFLKALAADVDTIEVVHWDNRAWGETPADFGYKSKSQIHAIPESAL